MAAETYTVQLLTPPPQTVGFAVSAGGTGTVDTVVLASVDGTYLHIATITAIDGSPLRGQWLITAANAVGSLGIAVVNVAEDDFEYTLTDAVSGIGGVVTGQFIIPLTIKDDLSAIVPYCECTITTTTSAVHSSGYTNSAGIIEFKLNEGVYYLWRNKAGYAFSDPVTLTINSLGELTV